MSEIHDEIGVVTTEPGEFEYPEKYKDQSYEFDYSSPIPWSDEDCFVLVAQYKNEDDYGQPQVFWDSIGIIKP